ncbi:MAG: hypothetical protein NT061_07340 [Spirochaetes bacterium]|nr:hypothetical protein [Spirochaetota bacterium]
MDNRSLTFQVPEIPVYDEARLVSTSSTRIVINGPGVTNYTATKSHRKSTAGSSSIKGYPSDTTNGYVTYDLSAVPFRAGGSYSLLISYIDWNGSMITSLTKTINFPIPKLKYIADVSNPFNPLFSWSYVGTDYSTWVSEYRVYLDDRYKGLTTGDSYQLSDILVPGSSHTWYVMPYNTDGTTFFSSTTGLVQSLTLKIHTGMTVTASEPAANGILIVGESYNFRGSAVFAEGATEARSVWTIGSGTKNGMEVTWSPTQRYMANSLSAFLTVTDSLALSKNSQIIYLTVLEPAVALLASTTRTVVKNTQVPLAVDSQNTRDVVSYEWFVDGSSIGTGSQKNFTFADVGQHEVYVTGTTRADLNGTTKTVESAKAKVTVTGNAPVVSIAKPESGVSLILGTSVRVTANVENENPMGTITWTVSGPDVSQNGTTGSQLNFAPRTAGEYTLTITAIDTYQKQGQTSVRINVTDPVMTVASPAQNAVFALTATLSPVMNAPNAARISWFIDEVQMGSSFKKLSELGTGSHQLYAIGYWNAVDSTGNPTEYSKESARISFSVKDLTPPVVTIGFPRNGMVMKTGENYRFSADVSPSSSSAAAWWEIDGIRLASNSYSPPAGLARKLLAVSYHVRNADGITGAASVSVKIVDPAVYFSAPSVTEFKVGTVIPVSASTADSELYWIVDGIETGAWNKTFTQTGQHMVQAGWRVNAVDSGGGTREFTGQSAAIRLSIYSDQPPVITSFSPSGSTVREAMGRNTDFSLGASSDNTLLPIAWRILNNGTVVTEATGNSISHSFGEAGQFTVRATVADSHGLSVYHEWIVKIISPSISITSPADGTVFAMNSIPTPVVITSDLSSYSFILDGTALPSAFNWNSVAQGSHSLYVVGKFVTSGSASELSIYSNSVSFAVENRTPPSFSIVGIKDGDRIIAGKQYNFTVTKSGGETIKWFRNGALVSGSGTQGAEYSFTPSASDNEINFTVRGILNNITADKSFRVKVIDPYISIIMPAAMAVNGKFPSRTAIPLQVEKRDIDRVVWTVDNQTYSSLTASFEPGAHSISVRGFASGVRLPAAVYGEYEYAGSGITSRDVSVAGRVAIVSVSALPASLALGDTLTIQTTISGGEDLIASYTYKMDDIVIGQMQTPRFAISTLPVGRHVISVTALDSFGTGTAKETTVTVYPPLAISITQPANEARLSPDANFMVSMAIVSGQATGISWRIDGNLVPNSNFASGSLGRLLPGRHVVSANATDPLGRTASASVNIEVQIDFQLNLLTPASGAELIVGNTVTCMAGADRVAGSQFNLNDAAQYISWFVNGANTGSKGLTYNFTGTALGSQRIQARYEKGDMTRTTPERTVIVRDIAEPIINQPLNGAAITYSVGRTIALSASGEAGAAFSWSIDGTVIAVGSDTSFNPNGLTGQKQLKLTTAAFGRTKEKLTTINLTVNSPPTLSLATPAIQYTGQTLSWTASAFDVEDQNASPLIEIFFDGVKLTSGTARVLLAGDIGQHLLSASTRDSQGVTATRQVPFSVEAGQLAVDIQSPMAGGTYFREYNLPLMATLGTQGGDASGTGSFNWTVQYLDDTTVQPELFTGASASFRPKALGEAAITVRYLDSRGMERGTKKISVNVARTPLALSIYWPHGSVVNSGDVLTPDILGLPQNIAAGRVTWALNGQTLNSISSLRAPETPGPYTLVAQYSENGSVDRAEVGFLVNGNPKVTIADTTPGGQYAAGTPIVLSARVEDDQAYTGTIAWMKQDGTRIGDGNPFLLNNAAPGEWRIIGTAVDNYGAKGTGTLSLRVYTPVSAITATINNGQPAYLVSEGSAPLAVRADYTGGIAPLVSWTLKQGERSVTKTGREAAFTYSDLTAFSEGPAFITALVVDSDLANEGAREIFRRDYPVGLTRNALATLTSPVSGNLFWVNEAIPVTVALTGFVLPTFTMKLNDVLVAGSWSSVDGTRLYTSMIPASLLQTEGVFKLDISASENSLTRDLTFTLNVYRQRSGVFVDNAPAEFNLEGGAGSVEAVVAGLTGVDSIQWHTDLAAASVATGPRLDLTSARLTPGNRSITVDALSGTRVLSSFTFFLRVMGPMNLGISPTNEPLIMQKGTQFILEAAAQDRNGSTLTGNAITWTSHLNGFLGRGTSLNLGNLNQLSIGEHVITVEATGRDGRKLSVLKRIRVNAADGGQGQNQDQGTDDQDKNTPPSFDPGNPIDPNTGGTRGSFGPGGRPADPGLLGIFNNLFGK